ncbi:hypothetical protein TWF281_004402 [Arthrobotrys megalospora]
MNRNVWNRHEDDDLNAEDELNISGPKFARLAPSEANPEALPNVNANSSITAPVWDDSSTEGNPLVQTYDKVYCGPPGNEQEGKLLNFLDIYDAPESDLEKLAAKYLPFGFAKVRFPTVTRFIDIKSASDIGHLRIHRSRVNIYYFNVFQDSFLKRAFKYGIKTAFEDESLRGVLVVEEGTPTHHLH